MPLTNAEKQARHRDRLKAKLERLAVLEAFVASLVNRDDNIGDDARQALASGHIRQPAPGVYDPIRHARNLKGQY